MNLPFSSLFIVGFLVFSLEFPAPQNEQKFIVTDPVLTDNADAIVVREDFTVNIEDTDKISWILERTVTVLNPNGNKSLQSYVHYDNARKVKKLEAFVYDALGNEIKKFKERDFADVSAVDGGTLYSDSRVKYLEYTPVRYPYTFSISYEIESSDSALVPSWYFQDSYRVSVAESRYTVSYFDPAYKPRVSERNFKEFQIEKQESSLQFSYVARNIPAVDEEAMSPSIKEIVPYLRVGVTQFEYQGIAGSARSWEEIGGWLYDNLIGGRDELPEATIQKVRLLTKGVEDPIEKARLIYAFVQENTRYISVQVGIGGIQPISATDVDQVKYGDCKGLTNYTMALLKAVGVPSYYAHVESGREKVSFEEDFPDLFDGDHVILAIPQGDDYCWLDCTSQFHPFGFLGDFTDDRNVLLIGPEGGKLLRTPTYPDSTNLQITTAQYSLSPEGSLKAEVEIVSTGLQYDYRFLMHTKSEKDKIQSYKNYWGHLSRLEFQDISYDNDRNQVQFKEKLQLSAESYGNRIGDRILFPLNAFNRTSTVPERYRKRNLPFKISRGYQDKEKYTIKIPQGFSLEAIPEPVNIESEFGSYRMQVNFDVAEAAIHYNRTLVIKEGQYEASKYNTYREFRKAIAKAEMSQAVLHAN